MKLLSYIFIKKDRIAELQPYKGATIRIFKKRKKYILALVYYIFYYNRASKKTLQSNYSFPEFPKHCLKRVL